MIHSFAKAYHINLDEYARSQFSDYSSFNDFFTRELKSDARPIDETPNQLICPADGTISQIGDIKQGMILQAKVAPMRLGNCLLIMTMVSIL